MDPSILIDLYCERTAVGFWNEPINALTNISFVIAAVLAMRIALGRTQKDLPEIVVILLAGTIGFGSFAFHTLANSAAELADVVPIWTFVALFVLLVIYRATDENLYRTGRIALIAGVITGVIVWFTSSDITTDSAAGPALLNRSLQYAPALAALIAFSLITARRSHPARGYIAAATLVFFASLVFRTVDLSTCETTKIGTHFMWHLLNGLMVGILLAALVKHFPPKGR